MTEQKPSGSYNVAVSRPDFSPVTITHPVRIIDMQVSIDECCLLQRLRQLRGEIREKKVLQKQEIRVIIDVTDEGIEWWVAERGERAHLD